MGLQLIRRTGPWTAGAAVLVALAIAVLHERYCWCGLGRAVSGSGQLSYQVDDHSYLLVGRTVSFFVDRRKEIAAYTACPGRMVGRWLVWKWDCMRGVPLGDPVKGLGGEFADFADGGVQIHYCSVHARLDRNGYCIPDRRLVMKFY